MTKQEEIDRILTRHTGRTGIHLDVVKRELSKAGVVIKVERELPENPYELKEGEVSKAHILGDEDYTIMSNEINEDYLKFGYRVGVDKMLKAGYVAVEPLIREENG